MTLETAKSDKLVPTDPSLLNRMGKERTKKDLKISRMKTYEHHMELDCHTSQLLLYFKVGDSNKHTK